MGTVKIAVIKKYFLFFTVITVFISCKQTADKTSAPVLYDSAYISAVFADSHRLEKIKAAFTVIDSMYKKHATDNHFPAISFGLVVDGQLAYKNSYGYTDVAKQIPATSSSLFRIASMSKSFTCMAILKLRDEGKLNVDDPAYLYIDSATTPFTFYRSKNDPFIILICKDQRDTGVIKNFIGMFG